jgi:hypothetical protein
VTEPRRCAPSAIRIGDRTQQVAVETFIAAVPRDMIVDRFLGQVQQPTDLRLDPTGFPQCLKRVWPPRTGLQIFDRSRLAEPAAQHLHVSNQRVIASRFGIRKQICQRPPDQLLLGAPLDRLEPRHNPRFRRESGEERLREGMDGLDLQATGAIQHLRKQLPRPLEQPVVRHLAERLEVAPQFASLQAHPCREPRADAIGHLGRGGLGEGQAQDRFGPRALEQQPEHARGQHLRLSGPGRSGQRRVNRGIGGQRLIAEERLREFEALAHRATNAIESAG